MYKAKNLSHNWVEGSLIQCHTGNFILESNEQIDLRPEYHRQGMGCGLEDRNITDRYEAMEYGWEEAMQRIEEYLPNYIEIDIKTVCKFTGLTDIYNNKIFSNDLRMDNQGELFRIYEVNGGFVIKAGYWKKNTDDLIFGDELIFEHLSNIQTADWLCETTKSVGNYYDYETK